MPNNVYADSLVRKSFIKVLTAWEQRALKELSKDFMLNYFSRVANLENDITKLNISPSTNDVIAADCSCSTSSDYCEDSANYSYTCGTMNPKDCSDTWGCGTLFIHTCNGKCRRGAPEP